MRFKLKKTLVLSLSFLLLIYFSFPWWGAYFIKQAMPSGWQTSYLSVSLPTWSGVKIEKIEITHQVGKFEINQLTIDYQFESVFVDDLIFKRPISKSLNTNEKSQKLRLDRVDIGQLIDMIPIRNLHIDNIKIVEQSNQYSASNFRASKEYDGEIQLIFNLNPLLYLKDKSKIKIVINSRPKVSNFQIQVNDFGLLELDYRLDKHKQRVNADIELSTISKLLPELTKDVFLTGKLKLELEQQQEQDHNQSQEQTINTLISRFYYSGPLHTSWNKNHAIHVDLEAKTRSDQFPLTIAVNSNAKVELLPLAENFLVLDNASVESSHLITMDINEISIDKNASILKAQSINLTQQGIKLNNSETSISADTIVLDLFDLDSFNPEKLAFNLDVKALDLVKKNAEESESTAKIFGKINIKGVANPKLDAELAINQINLAGNNNLGSISATLRTSEFELLSRRGKFLLDIKALANKFAGIEYESLKSELSLNLNLNLDGDFLEGINIIKVDNSELASTKIQADLKKKLFNVLAPKNKIDLSLLNLLSEQLKTQKMPQIIFIRGIVNHNGNYLIKNTDKTQFIIDGHLEIDNVELHFDENKMINLSGKIKSEFSEAAVTSQNSDDLQLAHATMNIEKIELASGLELSNISFNSMVKNTKNIEFDNLKLSAFSGQISGQKIKLVNDQLQPTSIKGEKLSLTELIFFMALDSVFATGEIDIEVPLLTSDGAFKVENGTFRSLGPGVIKYDSGSVVKQDENLALFALQNFHYSKLTGLFNYHDRSGQYNIKINLVGSNPELYDGYPIDFTFNIDGALPGVFKSLFLSGNFDQAILRSISTNDENN